MNKKIIIKIGSGVVSKNNKLNQKVLRQIVSEVVNLRKKKIEVILVTSGAVTVGKGILPKAKDVESTIQKQVFASVGQIKLMSIYSKLFKTSDYDCAQILVTREDFTNKEHSINMQNCFSKLLKDNIIPIVNENDITATRELIFTDNDELAGLLAKMLKVNVVIMMTNVDGVIQGDPQDKKAKVISEINLKDNSFEKYITKDKSPTGRGGMQNKIKIAKKLSEKNITTYIVNGTKKNVIEDLINGKKVGTKFLLK